MVATVPTNQSGWGGQPGMLIKGFWIPCISSARLTVTQLLGLGSPAGMPAERGTGADGQDRQGILRQLEETGLDVDSLAVPFSHDAVVGRRARGNGAIHCQDVVAFLLCRGVFERLYGYLPRRGHDRGVKA